MYVVSLIKDGVLIKTICKGNDQKAISVAREWVKLLKDSEGYVAIDKQVKAEQENVRYMQITFDKSKDNVELIMQEPMNNNYNVVSQVHPAVKMYAGAFLELALKTLLDYLQNQRTVKK